MVKPFVDAFGGFVLPHSPSTVPACADGTLVVFASRLCSPSRAHLFVHTEPGKGSAEQSAARGSAPVTATPRASAPVAV
jgi:hypothetical protein